MSWSGSGTAKTKMDIEGVVDVVDFQFTASPQTGNGAEESQRVIEVMKKFIPELLATGQFGYDASYRISANGHANTAHKPTEGWLNDSLSLSIYQE